MSASIVVSNLSWSTPDGRPLFTDLDLSFGEERAGLVGRNGVGKTTQLKLISGELQPQSGTVSASGRAAVPAPRRADQPPRPRLHRGGRGGASGL